MRTFLLTLTALLLLGAGAVYSWRAVDFGERALVFFRQGSELSGDRGHGWEGRHGRGFRPRGMEWSGEREFSRRPGDGFRAGQFLGERRGRFTGERDGFRERGRGRHGPGSAVSLERVGYYTCILAFVAMLTYQVSSLAGRWSDRRRSGARRT